MATIKRGAYTQNIVQFQETNSESVGTYSFQWDVTYADETGADTTTTLTQVQAAYKTLDLGGGSYIHYYKFDEAAIIRQLVAPMSSKALDDATNALYNVGVYPFSKTTALQLFGDGDESIYYPFMSSNDIDDYTEIGANAANLLWTDRIAREPIKVSVLNGSMVNAGFNTMFTPSDPCGFYGAWTPTGGTITAASSGVIPTSVNSASYVFLDAIGGIPAGATGFNGRWEEFAGNRDTDIHYFELDFDCYPTELRPLIIWLTSKGGIDSHVFCGRYEWSEVPSGELAEYGGIQSDMRYIRTRAMPEMVKVCNIYLSLTPNEWAWAKYIGASHQVIASDGTTQSYVHATWKEAPVFYDSETPASSEAVLTLTYTSELMPSS